MMNERMMLIEAIDRILSLNSDLFELEDIDIKGIKLEVLEGSYVWNEIELVSVLKNRIDSSEVQKDLSIFLPIADTEYCLSVYIRPRDKLILMSLTDLLLNTFTSSSFLDSSFAYSEDRDLLSYISRIVSWGPVDVVILVDLSESVCTLSRSRLMSKLSSAVTDPFILNLLFSFLNSPVILNIKNGPINFIDSKGIPCSGTEITSVFLNIYLDDFDRAFRSRLPQLPFARYCDEVIIPIRLDRPEDGSIESLIPIMDSLIEEFELTANYLSIQKGESKIDYRGGILSIDDKGFIYSFTNIKKKKE